MANGKPAPAPEGKVRARVLIDCALGRNGHVVMLSREEAADGVARGELDIHPDAVAYAEQAAADQAGPGDDAVIEA